MNEQFREDPEGKKDTNFEAVKTVIERQQSILEQIDAEKKKNKPNNELLENLMTQMETVNQEAQAAWDRYKKSSKVTQEKPEK